MINLYHVYNKIHYEVTMSDKGHKRTIKNVVGPWFRLISVTVRLL